MLYQRIVQSCADHLRCLQGTAPATPSSAAESQAAGAAPEVPAVSGTAATPPGTPCVGCANAMASVLVMLRLHLQGARFLPLCHGHFQPYGLASSHMWSWEPMLQPHTKFVLRHRGRRYACCCDAHSSPAALKDTPATTCCASTNLSRSWCCRPWAWRSCRCRTGGGGRQDAPHPGVRLSQQLPAGSSQGRP